MDNEQNLPTSPDWSKAPERAMYHAIDKDGTKTWFEQEPVLSDENSEWNNKDLTPFEMYDFMPGYYSDWRNSLQKRPDNV